MSDWQPIETAPKILGAPHILCAHAEKKWVRMGKWYAQEGCWYYSGTNERSQWSQVRGDEPTHWMALPKAPEF